MLSGRLLDHHLASIHDVHALRQTSHASTRDKRAVKTANHKLTTIGFDTIDGADTCNSQQSADVLELVTVIFTAAYRKLIRAFRTVFLCSRNDNRLRVEDTGILVVLETSIGNGKDGVFVVAGARCVVYSSNTLIG